MPCRGAREVLRLKSEEQVRQKLAPLNQVQVARVEASHLQSKASS